MKFLILDKTFELENNIESVEEIFDCIKEALEETEYNFSYLIIDGEEIHNDFELYLEDNIKSIGEVKAVMISTKNLIRANLINIDEYIERAIPIITKLADRFYKDVDSDDWSQVSELLEVIGFILHTFEGIDNMDNLNEIVSDYKVWNEYANEVKSIEYIVKSLNSSLEKNDKELVGKLLSSKVVPIFKNMNMKLDVLVAVINN